jgi:hypothetical protein
VSCWQHHNNPAEPAAGGDEHGQGVQHSLNQHLTITRTLLFLRTARKTHLNTIQQSHGLEPEAQDASQEEKGKQPAAIPGEEGQAAIQEEKDKPPRAELGGEGQARSKPQPTTKQ